MAPNHLPIRSTLQDPAYDRNRGAGLTSAFGDESYRRIRAVLDRRRKAAGLALPEPEPEPAPDEMRRFASIRDVRRAGFMPVAPGFWRDAHVIWELRGAEDGDGVVLVRKREERDVDLRTAGAGDGTAAAVEAGIVRTAQMVPGGPAMVGPGGENGEEMEPEEPKVPWPPEYIDISPMQYWWSGQGDVLYYLYSTPDTEVDVSDVERGISQIERDVANMPEDWYNEPEPENEMAEGGYTQTQVMLDDLKEYLARHGHTAGLRASVRRNAMQRTAARRGQLVSKQYIEGLVQKLVSLGVEAVQAAQYVARNEFGLISMLNDKGLEKTIQHILSELGQENAGSGDAAPLMGAEPMPAMPMGEMEGVEPPMEGGGLPVVGQKVLAVRNGSVADAVVMMVHPDAQAVDLMFGGGQKDEGVPIEMILAPLMNGEGGGGLGDIDDMPPMDAGPPGFDDTPLPGEEMEHDDIEVGAGDLPAAGPGGAGQDPFDVAVEPASKHEPIEEHLEAEHEADAGPTEVGADEPGEELRAYAMRCLRRWAAVDFMSAFKPGLKIKTTREFTPFYHGQKVRVPAEAEFVVEGFHRPTQDRWYGFPYLGRPAPKGTEFENTRVRLDRVGGGTLLVTLKELDQFFDPVSRELEEDEGAVPEMPGQPVGPHPDVSGEEPTSAYPPTVFQRTPVVQAPWAGQQQAGGY